MVIRDLSGGDVDAVMSLSHLFDEPARTDATRRFLADPGHHVLAAYDEGDERAVGFVTGVRTTHPDKGTEMFLYELAVDDHARNRGIGTALVAALADVARTTGCYGMWVLTDEDNLPAMRAYAAAGGTDPSVTTMLTWTFEEPR